MVRSPTETGGETHTVDLLKRESTLRTDATIERWPIGPTGVVARCTAFEVRSAPTLPVHPGREIRFEATVMCRRMPTGADVGSDKSESRSVDFRRRLESEKRASNLVATVWPSVILHQSYMPYVSDFTVCVSQADRHSQDITVPGQSSGRPHAFRANPGVSMSILLGSTLTVPVKLTASATSPGRRRAEALRGRLDASITSPIEGVGSLLSCSEPSLCTRGAVVLLFP